MTDACPAWKQKFEYNKQNSINIGMKRSLWSSFSSWIWSIVHRPCTDKSLAAQRTKNEAVDSFLTRTSHIGSAHSLYIQFLREKLDEHHKLNASHTHTSIQREEYCQRQSSDEDDPPIRE